jgi:hypothetical protein
MQHGSESLERKQGSFRKHVKNASSFILSKYLPHPPNTLKPFSNFILIHT